MTTPTGRSIWTGTLTFGLVAIPVKLFTATETHDVAFRQVHRADGARVQFRRFCSLDGEEIPYSEIAKGYELPTGDMVVLGENDLADLPLPTAKALEVLMFVDPGEVDPLMYSKSYYVLPASPVVAGSFALLSEAMRTTGRAGLVKMALRQRESLGLLRRDEDGGISLTMLLWPDEVRPAPKPDEVNLAPALVNQAQQLVEAMAGTFEPGDYTDEYATAVQAMLTDKINGTAPVAAPAAAASRVADLNDILKASVAAAKAARTTPKAAKTARTKKTAKAR